MFGRMSVFLFTVNTLNILSLRMQNVDYIYNKSTFKTLKHALVIDKHRIFYRGAVPLFVGLVNLQFTTDYLMNVFMTEE